jgi:hypothetical protein
MIILNIFLLFIVTELLLVIVNSCLERHLPHGLLTLLIGNVGKFFNVRKLSFTGLRHMKYLWGLQFVVGFITIYAISAYHH